MASASEDRLFEAVTVMEALRDTTFDLERVYELASEHGVPDSVSAGLAIAAGLSDLELAGGSKAARLRVLEWLVTGPRR